MLPVHETTHTACTALHAAFQPSLVLVGTALVAPALQRALVANEGDAEGRLDLLKDR